MVTLHAVSEPAQGLPSPAIRQVLAVARLGEVGLRDWWGSHGLATAGRYVLSASFPHTWRATAVELDIISATRRHEAILGRPTAVHLFSDQLPFRRRAVAWLAETKTGAAEASYLEHLEELDTDGVIEHLRGQVTIPLTSAEPTGPGLLLGKLNESELNDEATLSSVLQLLVAAYLDQSESLRPPYFDLVS